MSATIRAVDPSVRNASRGGASLTELILGAVVVDGQPSVVDKALERRLLIRQIADRVPERRLG